MIANGLRLSGFLTAQAVRNDSYFLGFVLLLGFSLHGGSCRHEPGQRATSLEIISHFNYHNFEKTYIK